MRTLARTIKQAPPTGLNQRASEHGFVAV